MVHSWATNTDDPTVMPRWGEIGVQKIEDAGTLYPKRMETVDDEILDLSLKFVDKAHNDGKPFFLWLNPTRMPGCANIGHSANGERPSLKRASQISIALLANAAELVLASARVLLGTRPTEAAKCRAGEDGSRHSR